MSAKLEINEKTRSKLKEPGRYKVVMYNDDFTPMDFVVNILMDVFRKSEQEAMAIMLAIHKGTKETVGEYVYDIAKTKADTCIQRARDAGYPFMVKIEQ